MSRQSLRSQKISSFYNFGYDIDNTNTNNQDFINISKETVNPGATGNVVFLDNQGQRQTAYNTGSVSIGSNVGDKISIGFDCAFSLQRDDAICVGTNNCKNEQVTYGTCIGNNNCLIRQDNGGLCIGSSNYTDTVLNRANQGRNSVAIGNNIQGLQSDDTIAIGNDIFFPGGEGVNIGNNQSILNAVETSSFIGSDILVSGNRNIEYSIIGNDIRIQTTTPADNVRKNAVIFGNDIKPFNLISADINTTIIGNNIGSNNLSSSFVIGNNSCENLINNGVISIGNYSLPESEINVISIGNFNGRKTTQTTKQNNILIGSGINTSSSNSLIINTYSTDYEVSPENFTKFILRCPIRPLNHNIGVNKLHYNPTTEELTYSIS